MNTKRLGFLLLVTLLLAPLGVQPISAQSSGGNMQWGLIDGIGSAGNVVVNPSEVSEFTIGAGGVFYAIDIPNSKVYRSQSSGLDWDEITSFLTLAGAALPVTAIAASPSDSGLLAAVTNGGTKVFLSLNGGLAWADTGAPAPAGQIQAITFSPQYSDGGNTVSELAIGSALWGNGTTDGNLALVRLGNFFSSWQLQNLRVDPAVIGGEISSIVYSPNYATDRNIAVVASTNADVAAAFAGKTWLCLGTRDTSAGITNWNTAAGYPVMVGTVASPSGDAPGVTGVVSSLALPSNFSGAAPATTKAFVSYDRTPNANDDVYRIDNTIVTRLNAAGGAVIDLTSIAYQGSTTSGKLLAGSKLPAAGIYAEVLISLNPLVVGSTWTAPSQRPTGPGNARVRWSGSSTAYCGTSSSPGSVSDESAFQISSDSGDTWQQISLIDTRIIYLDVALAASPASAFVVTTNAAGIESVWRNAGEPLSRYWARIYTIDAASNQVIIRLSPNYSTDYTLYIAEVGGTQMAVSTSRGNVWTLRRAPAAVVDMAVVSRDVLYVATAAGRVSKSLNGAFFWELPVSSGLPAANMITLSPDGKTVLVGGTGGDAAWSDDGKNFNLFPTLGAGAVQVTTDSSFAANGIVYAGAGNRILRNQRPAGGAWGNWQAIRTLPATAGVTGMALVGGILYASWYDAGTLGSGAERSLDATPAVPEIEWDSLVTGAAAAQFDAPPQTLHILSLSTEIRLWAIDTLADTLMAYRDVMAKASPVVTPPGNVAPGATLGTISVDPVTGGNRQVAIHWTGISESAEYDVEIYADSGLSELVARAPVVPPATGYRPANSVDPSWVVPAGLLSSGAEYWVRIRVRAEIQGQQVQSAWSTPLKFTVMAGNPVVSSQSGPMPATPGPDAPNVSLRPGLSWSGVPDTTAYELEIAEDAAMARLLPGAPFRVSATTAWQPAANLAYETTYFWRVRAILPVPSAWSPVLNFTTIPAPAPSTTPAPTPTPTMRVVIPPEAVAAPDLPTWVIWTIIASCAVLFGAITVLVLRTSKPPVYR